jgi:hypothetical protein
MRFASGADLAEDRAAAFAVFWGRNLASKPADRLFG